MKMNSLQDSKIWTELEQSFQYRNSGRKEKSKGVDETHLILLRTNF